MGKKLRTKGDRTRPDPNFGALGRKYLILGDERAAGDPESPLDILRSWETYPRRSGITSDQHRAGCQYAELRHKVFGRAVGGAAPLIKLDKGVDGHGATREQQRAYTDAVVALSKAGSEAVRVVGEVCVFMRAPRQRDREALRQGLNVLAAHFRG